MKHERIQQLDEAVSEVFSIMLGRECRPGTCASSPLELTGRLHSSQPGNAISALIRFSGSMSGTCAIHLGLHSAAAITGDLLGPFPLAETRALTADAAGELCNMIAGSWKSRQSDGYASCALSPPLITTPNLLLTPTSLLLTDTRPPETDSPSESAFRNTLIRVYRFEDHCLRLELGID